MAKKRRQHSAKLKFQVALEAAKGTKTINEIAGQYSIHPNQVRNWKRQLMEDGVTVFSQNGSTQQRDQELQEAQLYEQIGRLKMELEWLKKKVTEFS